MSNLLWRHYLEDDVERFLKLLANGYNASQCVSKGHSGGTGGPGSVGAVPGSPASGFGTSPRATTKTRKSSGYGNLGSTKGQINSLSRNDLNTRDRSGLTLLHRASSSRGSNAIPFALALIDHVMVDIYMQDLESGWTALHRALYFGNVTVARALLDRDLRDSMGQGTGNASLRTYTLIKIKDHEGNSAFDVYNATIARRTLQNISPSNLAQGSEVDDDDSVRPGGMENGGNFHSSIGSDEMFAFGSNKNLTLGFSDEDDRQHPEKINLKRPDHLLHRFYRDQLPSNSNSREASTDRLQASLNSVLELPALVKNRPIIIQDVALSKLHSAILTTDPQSNLYTCGFGPGGRLGTGDETTRFNYVCIEGGGLAGKKIVAVALGQNHSIAVSDEGEVFTWGTNTWGQLGYTLPRPVLQDEEPVNSIPRQIFGPLKREVILGVAASAIHSVAFTSTSLYTWGKNEGQLGLMDSDSRSLEAQIVPRRVAASLFTSPIQMVSAINRATICLLANHAMYVFTNYGYNNVKFPMHDGFSNYHLNSTSLTTRYEAEPSHISSVTSGGETIAAISSRGDLFTLSVSQKLDASPTATSTTNPAKIRNALSQPQRVWSLRKGNWDGIKSIGVGEDGSVIICTQAGAVWRQIPRPKIKITYLSVTSGSKSKDYKFQRVPGLTKVAAVRSNTFGAYAALRKDCDVTKTQITVTPQTLWADVAPLFGLWNLRASESRGDLEERSRFWMPTISNENIDPFKRAVLVSPDIEAEVICMVQNNAIKIEDYDVDVLTTLSDASIPAHGFILAARSSILRDALRVYRKQGSNTTETFTVTGGKKPKVLFIGVDFLTILNLVLYAYTDKIVDVWLFTRHAPKSAFRYRQVRVELMKLASRLGMSRLESAVRLMSEPEPCLHLDLAEAFEDPVFFEDGDAVVELDGSSVTVHSALVRQRCPFFEGLFNGRAAGQWITERRKTKANTIKIDMKHIEPSVFKLVLCHLYADVGAELFDRVVTTSIDDFCDVVMDVLSVANELMLDRLSQACQQVIGRFVNTRNVCQLINTVAPCSVTEFKDAGLEYLCLQLEAMLENHLLDELDEDLMHELDEVVRGNQLACLPFTKSGRSDLLLHERHPSLAADINEERQRKIRDMAFQWSIKEDDTRLSSSFRARVGSVEDIILSPSSHEKLRKKTKTSRNAPFSPAIGPKDSTADLMFDMDDDDAVVLDNRASPKQIHKDQITEPSSRPARPTSSKQTLDNPRSREISNVDRSSLISPKLPLPTPSTLSPTTITDFSRAEAVSAVSGTPWSSTTLPSSKLEEIMAQTSRGRTSTLSLSLSAEKAQAEAAAKAATPKVSQKERKKQQQQQQQALQQAVMQQPTAGKNTPTTKSLTPWQIPRVHPTITLKDILGAEANNIPSAMLSEPSGFPTPALAQHKRRTASPDTRFAGQPRSLVSTSQGKPEAMSSPSYASMRATTQLLTPKSAHLTPRSLSYIDPVGKAEPSLQLSMADIIGQQKREQDLIKEAVAKRSLQEIQEEQAFQEWWDQESRRTQEEEAMRALSSASAVGPNGSTRGKGGRRGRGGGQRGKGDSPQSRGRGRGRSRGGGAGSN